MNDSRRVASLLGVGAVLAAGAVGVLGQALGLGSTRPPAPDEAQQFQPSRHAAAYAALRPLEGAGDTRLPVWSSERGDDLATTAIGVTNASPGESRVVLHLLDPDGKELDCAGCAVDLPGGGSHVFWPPRLGGTGNLFAGTFGEASIESSGRAVAAVAEVHLTGGLDHTAYAGLGADAELPPPTSPEQPIALNNADVPGVSGRALVDLHVANLDRQSAVVATVSLFPWDASPPTSRRLTIDAGRTQVLSLAPLSSITPGQYASAITAQGQVGLVTRSAWPGTGATTLDEGVHADSDLAAPIVFKSSAGRCSTVVVHNVSAEAATEVSVELHLPEGGPPVMQVPVTVPARGTTPLALCEARAFDALPDGFVGAMLLRSGKGPVSAEVLTAYSTPPAVAGYGALPVDAAGPVLLAPLVHSSWQYAPEARVPQAHDSVIAVQNPTRATLSVTAIYTGTMGTCEGQVFREKERSLPALGHVLFAPGDQREGLLPPGCVAAASVHSPEGGVVAVVLDETWPQQPRTPTATSTSAPTDTPTSTDTATELPTATATSRATLSATPVETETATDTPGATDTPRSTQRATATFVPTRTPPSEPPRPAATQVAPSQWTRADKSNSLLPHDQVRFLHVDRQGNTWLRLVNPAGGADAVVTVSRDGVWETYRGGLRAVVQSLPFGALRGLEAVRDFYDTDGGGRVWIGPELYDGNGWTVVAGDDPGPAGAVHYEQRTLIDGNEGAWVPLSATRDCVPPNPCGNEAVRVFSPDGQFSADVPLDEVPDAARYGVDHVHLVTIRGETGGTGGSTMRSTQAGAPAWVVAPGAYYASPATSPNYYPYLDPREFLATGLRNSGYATAATYAPSGRLQVITWVELDLGSSVEHRIFLNTLHADGWEVEDLTGSPLLGGSVEFERVVAMDYCPDGELWLGTAGGAVAVRRDGERTDGEWTVYPSDSGLFEPGELVTDIACGNDGAIWIGSRSGLLGYGFAPPPFRLFTPFVSSGGP